MPMTLPKTLTARIQRTRTVALDRANCYAAVTSLPAQLPGRTARLQGTLRACSEAGQRVSLRSFARNKDGAIVASAAWTDAAGRGQMIPTIRVRVERGPQRV